MMGNPKDESTSENEVPSNVDEQTLAAKPAVKALENGQGKDVDIAAQILADYGEEFDRSWTPEEEKRLIRKVDWMIVPILFVCATLSGLDKTAISAAAIYGIRQDLNLTGEQYSWVGSAPFFGGLLFMGPSAYFIQSVILNVVAPIINGFVAWVIGYYNGSYAKWKIVFLLVGCVTIAWSAVIFFFLPSNPLEAKRLSPRERYIIIQRKASDNTGIENKVFKPAQVKEAFADVKTWLIWFAIIALQVPNGGLTTFNTLIISGLGFNPLQTSLLAMPPGAMSTISGIVLSYIASTTRKYRTPIVAGSILLPLFGALLCYNLPRDNLAGQLIGL
ncbi:putative transporter [Colletotrichum sp. SAR11_59]|nr:putative transporter [Colletotrichum sp. SAR11_59]